MMKTPRKKYRIAICAVIFYGFTGPVSSLSNIDAGAPSRNVTMPPATASDFLPFTGEVLPARPAEAEADELASLADTPRPGATALQASPNKAAPKLLRSLLNHYYEGTDVLHQERAFKRVISWKEDFENIAAKYPNVDWKMLSAIIKAETQGRTGRQESKAMAVGISQIKYQGAWAFIWDALFKTEIKSENGYVKDYYNVHIRRRYRTQLQHICQYLEDHEILVRPASGSEEHYRGARSDSWNNLKAHLEKKYAPGEYQVAVDIAAIYLDHIITTFQSINHQVLKIKETIESNRFERFGSVKLSGTARIRWDSIRSKLLDHSRVETNLQEKVLTRINHILNRLEDPNIYSAAYNLGISSCLKYMESGMKFPEGISRYVKKVSRYQAIFEEIDAYRLFT